MQSLVLVVAAMLAGAPAGEPGKWRVNDSLTKMWDKAGLPQEMSSQRPEAKVDGNSAIVRNRGCIVSTGEYPKGCVLDFLWQWTEGREAGAYQDVLMVGFGTDGRLSPKWTFECPDGILVGLEANTPKIAIFQRRGNIGVEGTRKEKKGVEMKRDTWYHARIELRYDEEVKVYFGEADDYPSFDSSRQRRCVGKSYRRCPWRARRLWRRRQLRVIDEAIPMEPALSAPVPGSNEFKHHSVIIYNREWVAAVPKESRLKNIRLEALD